MITDNGVCLVNGELMTTCWKPFVFSVSDCEAGCTAHEPCVGYSYYPDPLDYCYLIPSTYSCPTGYSFEEYPLLAKTSNDLEAETTTFESSGGVCYGKNVGNINLPRLYNAMLKISQ